MSIDKQVYRFGVTLKPLVNIKAKDKVYREIEILSSQNLSFLAKTIIKSFGFDFDHCYGFYEHLQNPYKSQQIFKLFTDLPEEEHTPGALGVTHVKINQSFEKIGKKMLFLFDYGDNWQFVVELLSINPSKMNTKYPRVIRKIGQAPEQYPPLEEENDQEWYRDDCPLYQELKKRGGELHWFPDMVTKKHRPVN